MTQYLTVDHEYFMVWTSEDRKRRTIAAKCELTQDEVLKLFTSESEFKNWQIDKKIGPSQLAVRPPYVSKEQRYTNWRVSQK